MNKFVSKSPFHAEAAVVRTHILHAGHLDHPVVPHMEVQLTANAAIGAGGPHQLGLPF